MEIWKKKAGSHSWIMNHTKDYKSYTLLYLFSYSFEKYYSYIILGNMVQFCNIFYSFCDA
jgi:hypothetical protein